MVDNELVELRSISLALNDHENDYRSSTLCLPAELYSVLSFRDTRFVS